MTAPKISKMISNTPIISLLKRLSYTESH